MRRMAHGGFLEALKDGTARSIPKLSSRKKLRRTPSLVELSSQSAFWWHWLQTAMFGVLKALIDGVELSL